MARRIRAEKPNMTPETLKIINDLFCEWEHADINTYDAEQKILQTKWKGAP